MSNVLKRKRAGEAKTFYQVWQEELALVSPNDSISAVSWSVPTGLTKVSEGKNASAIVLDDVSYPADTVALVKVSGGTVGQKYAMECTVTTANGETLLATMRVEIVESYE